MITFSLRRSCDQSLPPSSCLQCLVRFYVYSREKQKCFLVPNPKKKKERKHRPGLMAQMLRAGTGDSMGRCRRYRWSTLINDDSNLLMCGIFLIKLIPLTNNRELKKRPTIWILVQLLWTFGHFAPQQKLLLPNNCTILVCFHPLLTGKLKFCLNFPQTKSNFSTHVIRILLKGVSWTIFFSEHEVSIIF